MLRAVQKSADTPSRIQVAKEYVHAGKTSDD